MMEFHNSPLSIENLPLAEDIEYVPVHQKYKTILRVNLLGTIGLLTVIFITLDFFPNIQLISYPYKYIVYALIFLYLIVQWIVIEKSYPFMAYAIRERDIHFRSGWIFKKWTHIPFSRIQHAEVTQGFLSRSFDLAKLKVYTAGGSGSDLSIPGLNFVVANRLKALILKNLADERDEEE